jgi:hypothetical protein
MGDLVHPMDRSSGGSTNEWPYSSLGENLACSVRQSWTLLEILVCAQFVPKICQESQNVSKDIDLYRNPEYLKNGLFSGDFY